MDHSPVSSKERIGSIDIIRGLAIFGIFLVNMQAFQWPEVVGIMYMITPEYSAVDQWIRLVFDVFVQGKFYTIFSFLFGLGFYIFMKRAEEKGLKVNRLFSRRLAVLAVFGMLHLVFLWYGDILLTYAIAGFFLLLFYKRKPKTILAWILGLSLMSVAVMSLNLLVPKEIIDEIAVESIAEGEGKVEEAIAVYQNASFGEWVAYRFGNEVVPLLQNLPFVVPAVLFMFLFGLYAGKKGIFSNPSRHLKLIKGVWWSALIVSLPFSGAIVWVHMNVAEGYWKTLLMQPLLGITGPLMALFYISTLLLLLRKDLWQKLLRPFSYAGRMALTNYIAQSLIGMGIFTGLGFFGEVNLLAGTLICLVVFPLQVVFSYYWLKKFRFGPLEWLWRTLTYKKLQPFKKEKAATPQS